MINTITKCQFSDAFRDMGRKEQFSYEGLNALYDYLTEMEESCDMQIELDVISLCCDFCEYDDLEEVLNEYDLSSLRDLQNNTSVIELKNGGIIIQAF